jgi:hypothetical protein
MSDNSEYKNVEVHKGENVKKTKWYKIICQHCDDEGYISFVTKLPLYSENIDDVENFEVLPHEDSGRVRIRHICNWCGGRKYYLYPSGDWELEIIEPK